MGKKALVFSIVLNVSLIVVVFLLALMYLNLEKEYNSISFKGYICLPTEKEALKVGKAYLEIVDNREYEDYELEVEYIDEEDLWHIYYMSDEEREGKILVAGYRGVWLHKGNGMFVYKM